MKIENNRTDKRQRQGGHTESGRRRTQRVGGQVHRNREDPVGLEKMRRGNQRKPRNLFFMCLMHRQ